VDKTSTVLENRVLRKISGHKAKDETGGYRKKYKEELCDLYSSNRSRVIKHQEEIGGEYNTHERQVYLPSLGKTGG
jgi:hypothetical protein